MTNSRLVHVLLWLLMSRKVALGGLVLVGELLLVQGGADDGVGFDAVATRLVWCSRACFLCFELLVGGGADWVICVALILVQESVGARLRIVCTQRGLGAVSHSGRLLINCRRFRLLGWVCETIRLFNSFYLCRSLSFSAKPTLIVANQHRPWLWVEILPTFLRAWLQRLARLSQHLNALVSLFLCHSSFLRLLYLQHWIKLLLQHQILLLQLFNGVIKYLSSFALSSFIHHNTPGIEIVIQFWLISLLLITSWWFSMTS